jgi:tetratricopeptide (TPR) repeat protein
MVARISNEPFKPASQTPQPDPSDSEEVVMALERARAHEAQGALREAARWLRSAADRAERGGNDERVLVFARAAADLTNNTGSTPPPDAATSSPPASTVRKRGSVRPPAPKPAAWSSAPPSSARVSSPPPVPARIPTPRPVLPASPSAGAPRAAFASGSDTGFRSFLLLVPEKNISVMVACNYDLCRSRDIALAVLDLLLGEEPDEVKTQIGFSFSEVLIKDGLEAAKNFYKTTNEDSTQRKYFLWKEDDGALTYPGYLFLDQKMFNEALEVFKFNVEINPNSAWAYGHLGVGYARTGNKDLARENFQSNRIIPMRKF